MKNEQVLSHARMEISAEACLFFPQRLFFTLTFTFTKPEQTSFAFPHLQTYCSVKQGHVEGTELGLSTTGRVTPYKSRK